jgi:hypothetical protein
LAWFLHVGGQALNRRLQRQLGAASFNVLLQTASQCIILTTLASVQFTLRHPIGGRMKDGKRLMTWSIRVDDALDTAVKQLAEKDLRTVSNYVEMVVRKHLADLGVQIEPPPKAPKSKRGGR